MLKSNCCLVTKLKLCFFAQVYSTQITFFFVFICFFFKLFFYFWVIVHLLGKCLKLRILVENTHTLKQCSKKKMKYLSFLDAFPFSGYSYGPLVQPENARASKTLKPFILFFLEMFLVCLFPTNICNCSQKKDPSFWQKEVKKWEKDKLQKN